MKEELIILLAKEGDEEAFHELYKRYRRKVFLSAFQLIRLQEDAEDIMHEAFIRAFKNIRSFDLQKSAGFGAWINRICVNCTIEHLRKRKHRNPLQLNTLANPGSDPQAEDPSPEEAVASSQILQRLYAALSVLTPKQRTIFGMRYAQNMDVKEIASSLQCSESTVKTQHLRAVAKLRRRLEPLWRST